MIKIEKPLRFISFLVIGFGLCCLLLIIIAFFVAWGKTEMQLTSDYMLEDGKSAIGVWNDLVQQNYTNRTLPWRYYAWKMDAASRLQSGTYRIEKGAHIKDVIEMFVSGDDLPDELTVTYPEGFTLKQIAARTAMKGIATEQAFTGAAYPKSFSQEFGFLKEIPAGRDLEGYLFPDTYKVFEDDGAKEVIQRMLANFDNKFNEELIREAEAQGRTIDEVVIMASIIEREVTSNDDMAIISGILWKRLDDGVGLAADATIRYALDKWKEPLTVQDLANDSPYNTRKWRGLPPGPISNPGLQALQAAVRPQQSAYYYYLSAPSGETIFSRTLEEHNANKAKYLY